jgi:hypothetical protein
MLRRDAWGELGGMDEGFQPIWFEDVDFLFRLRTRGYRISYVPTVRARHVGGHSVRQVDSSCREVYWYGSLLRYASKHYGRLGRVAVCGAVMLGSLARMIVRLAVERSLEPAVVSGRVLRLAGGSLLGARSRGAGRFAAGMTG